MAQYTLNAYDADVYIPEFKGLMQYGDQMGDDLRYTPECNNVETPGGVLQPACAMLGSALTYSNEALSAVKGTLMYLRVWQLISQPVTYDLPNRMLTPYMKGDRYDCFVFAIGGAMYSRITAGDPMELSSMPLERIGDDFQSDEWSWCTYEHTYTNSGTPAPTPGAPEGTSNIIIMSNPKDGVYCYNGASLSNLNASVPGKFAYVARHGERIWGCGAEDHPDTLYYSSPFNAFDWAADTTDPANGGGEIRLPTWDKDRFVALKSFGDALIAFSEKRAWRITGTDPSNFIIQEQLGNGLKYPETLVEMNNRLLFLGDDGLMSYDGYQVVPFMKAATHEIFRNIYYAGETQPKAVRIGEKYVLALSNEIVDPNYVYDYTELGFAGFIPIPEFPVPERYGYKLVIYDDTDGSIVQRDVPRILSFCRNMPYVLTCITLESSSPVSMTKLRFDSWYERQVVSRAVKWVTPWITLGRKDIQKGGFEVYFTPELESKKSIEHQFWVNTDDNAPSIFTYTDESGPVTFKISIQTEKKTKTKYYTVQPLTEEQIAAGKGYKQKRLHFGGSGRRFRLIIEVEEGNTIPWRLIGGIQIIAETDKD